MDVGVADARSDHPPISGCDGPSIEPSPSDHSLGRVGAATIVSAMKVLVTGGAGYIGSTTAKALVEAGHVPVVLDDLSSGPQAFVRDRSFYVGDIADRRLLRRIFVEHPDIGCTIHMAAKIVVPESVERPYRYYHENVAKSLELFDELVALGSPRVVFSSSASLYALPTAGFEVTEDSPLAPSSPYARTKRMMEEALIDIAAATDLRAVILRYFNPVGSDPDLESGVYAREPSHVLGQLVLAATGKRDAFTITGTDLPTRDGTGIRDYIHIWDLARAHAAAVERFEEALAGGVSNTINLGTGDGVTVRELLATFERVYGRPVPVVEGPARPGDAVGAFANVDRARLLLDWAAQLTLAEAIASALAWAERRESVLGYP